jgi:hypothetical protein
MPPYDFTPALTGLGAILILLLWIDMRRRVRHTRVQVAERRSAYAAAIEGIASRLGITLAPARVPPDWPEFDLLHARGAVGWEARVCDAWAGRLEAMDVWLFRYEEHCNHDGPCDTAREHGGTGVCLRGPGAPLPWFHLPAGSTADIARLLQSPEVDVRTQLRFAEQFGYPEAADCMAIRRALTPAVIDWLAARPEVRVECKREHLLVHRIPEPASPDELIAFVSSALAFHRLLV